MSLFNVISRFVSFANIHR